LGKNPNISLTDQAYSRIEELIVTLQLPPGGAVSESEICAQTGFGRTPVREALMRLSQPVCPGDHGTVEPARASLLVPASPEGR
jgi:hypothetical protein